MPGEFRGRCVDCGHEWEALEYGYCAGCIDYQKPETYHCYFCPKCCVHLYVPRLVDANSWHRWLAANADNVRDFAILRLACEKLSAILSSRRTIYAPTEIDIGPLNCLECNEPMQLGTIGNSSLVCPNCGSRTARALGIHAIVTVRTEPADDAPPVAEGP
jgi:hypothetical protein